MTPKTAKALTLEKCLFRQVHLDGSYVRAWRAAAPEPDDFEMYEFHIVSSPIVAKVMKLKPDARIRYDGPTS